MLLGIKLQASGLMASAFIYWAMLPAFFFLWGGMWVDRKQSQVSSVHHVL